VTIPLPRTGRPPIPDHLRRSKLVLVKLTESEHRELRELADDSGVTVSDLMRQGGVSLGKTLSKGKRRVNRKEKKK
jgi:16S rRNA U516 pseudouridylate synthase RsuA-like enzyme